MHTNEIMYYDFSIDGMPRHSHNDIEIIYLLEGEIKLHYGQNSKLLTADNFVLINTNEVHYYEACSQSILVGRLYINYIMLSRLYNGAQLHYICDSTEALSEHYERLRYYIYQIFSYSSGTDGQDKIYRNQLFYQVLHILTIEFQIKEKIRTTDEKRTDDERSTMIMNYLHTRYNTSLTLGELADTLFLSPAYLSKYIKKEFGTGFAQLLNQIRMEYAVNELIHTNKPIIKVAMDNGFTNLTGFNRSFKQIYTVTPAKYRKTMKSKLRPSERQQSESINQKVENYFGLKSYDLPQEEKAGKLSIKVDSEQTAGLTSSPVMVLNIGTASELLNFDIREQILLMKKELNIHYIRIWNLLADQKLIEADTEKQKYNFSRIYKIIDFLKENDLFPYIEFGFKPREIRRNAENPLVIDSLPAHGYFWIENAELLDTFVHHVVARYGEGYVTGWYIELEKRAFGSYATSDKQYFTLFKKLYNGFKKYVPGIRIGGAGFNLNYIGKQYQTTIKQWAEYSVHPDFLSIYCFPHIVNEDDSEEGRRRNHYSSDKNILFNHITSIKSLLEELNFDIRSIHVTEWSLTISNRNTLNDGCFKGAYIMKHLIQNVGQADMIGYWGATDILADYYDSSSTIFGGCGLLSREGIKKPAFYALKFFQSCQKYILYQSENIIVTSDHRDCYVINCHNYKHLNFRFYLVDEDKIDPASHQHYFEDLQPLHMICHIRNVKNGWYQVKVRILDEDNGCILNELHQLGEGIELNQEELSYLKKICKPRTVLRRLKVVNHTLRIEISMMPQAIQNITVNFIQ